MRLLRPVLAALLLLAAGIATAADKPRYSFTVLCEDPALAKQLKTGIEERFTKAGYKNTDDAPNAKLFLFATKDDNSTKNPDGITVAIAHITNLPTLRLASDKLEAKEELPPVLIAMLGEQGFIHFLSAMHLDDASPKQVNLLLDSAVAAFFQRNATKADAGK